MYSGVDFHIHMWIGKLCRDPFSCVWKRPLLFLFFFLLISPILVHDDPVPAGPLVFPLLFQSFSFLFLRPSLHVPF